MAEKTLPPTESLSYEESLIELENIVQALESGQGTLEESIALFERGQALARRCAALLENAQLRVRTLSGESVDFDEAGDA